MITYKICPICGNLALARLNPPIDGVHYICDECAVELDYFKKPIKTEDDE